ncbi:hypothetical protein PBRA_004662 [Plasmodiophora brassicae]|uniref:PI3K/PI4K catalytic domain-containing protein n=1 Tax=Plasmodiophora brassicae TaxID=37360 RepID=A0A0G4ILI1_PLABS|nr:hypothetical protein PBRA_004662 [Plasmodiophora brassicae]
MPSVGAHQRACAVAALFVALRLASSNPGDPYGSTIWAAPVDLYGRANDICMDACSESFLLYQTLESWTRKDVPDFVFKLADGEYCSTEGVAVKAGVHYGDAAKKEVAASLLDHDGFAGVPEAMLAYVRIRFPLLGCTKVRYGALQRYVVNAGPSSDRAHQLPDTIFRFNIDNVHRIGTWRSGVWYDAIADLGTGTGLLDARLANLDRTTANILLSTDRLARLIPIDHGFSLPSWQALDDIQFCWASWSQARVPFSRSTKAYVAGLDPMSDVGVLQDLDIDNSSILTYLLCSVAVKHIVSQRGSTLAAIAAFMTRPCRTCQSQMEVAINASVWTSGFMPRALRDPPRIRIPSLRVEALLSEFQRYLNTNVNAPVAHTSIAV